MLVSIIIEKENADDVTNPSIDHSEYSKIQVKEQIEVWLKKFQKERKPALSNGYIVYLKEFGYNNVR